MVTIIEIPESLGKSISTIKIFELNNESWLYEINNGNIVIDYGTIIINNRGEIITYRINNGIQIEKPYHIFYNKLVMVINNENITFDRIQ